MKSKFVNINKCIIITFSFTRIDFIPRVLAQTGNVFGSIRKVIWRKTNLSQLTQLSYPESHWKSNMLLKDLVNPDIRKVIWRINLRKFYENIRRINLRQFDENISASHMPQHEQQIMTRRKIFYEFSMNRSHWRVHLLQWIVIANKNIWFHRDFWWWELTLVTTFMIWCTQVITWYTCNHI